MNQNHEPKRLLVVDDELAMRQALEASFRRVGWAVDIAPGLAEAIEKTRRASFPVVVTDMRMLDGTGLELLKEIHETAPATAVILLTAYASVPDAVLAMRGGACEYLVKPVSFVRLEAAAARAWGASQERQAAAGQNLSWQSFPSQLAELLQPAHISSPSDFRPAPTQLSPNVLYPGLPLREAERRLLEATLEATHGNRTRAAEMLGISLRTMRNKIRTYGLPPWRCA